MSTEDVNSDEKNVFDENRPSHQLNLLSRPLIVLGIDTIKQISSLKILIIGLKGVGAETAKNLILLGPQNITIYDNDIVTPKDLGTNFYLTKQNIINKYLKSDACLQQLSQLNPYCNVKNYKDNLSDNFIQSFDAVIVTKTLSQKELFRINYLCRNKTIPSTFILAVTHGVTAHIFIDFGPSHIVKDENGEPIQSYAINEFNKYGVITIAERRHGFHNGDMILINDICGDPIDNNDPDAMLIGNLLKSKPIKIKRTSNFNYITLDVNDIKSLNKLIIYGYVRQIMQISVPMEIINLLLFFFRLPLEPENLSKWIHGGSIIEVKQKKILKFRSLSECIKVPINKEHPDPSEWGKASGKLIHLLYYTALQFNENKGYFPRLHNKNDSKQFMNLLLKINKMNRESGIDGECFVDETQIDTKRINGYSWYFETELNGYCSFLGGIAAQEIVKKFGKFTPIHQWFHCDNIHLIGNEIPSDAIPQNSRYDYQISIFGKSFQYKLQNQTIFLVGCGALGCQYLKDLSLMGVATGNKGKIWCADTKQIKLSNLSTHCLFNNEHIGQSKSKIAASVIKQNNNKLNIQALEINVSEETENIFDDEFWGNLDFCWNAIDNEYTKQYVEDKCLLYQKSLLDSGIKGTKANSEVIIPYKTKSYQDTEEDDEIIDSPMDIIKNFPYTQEMCIDFAISRFNQFREYAIIYNKFIDDENFETLNQMHGLERYETIKLIEKFVNMDLNELYNECIKFAFNEFVEKHINKIKDITHIFPKDAMSSHGGNVKFWSGYKKFPQSAIFDLNAENVTNYLFAAANLWAFMFGIEQIREKNKFKQIVIKCGLKMQEWEIKKSVDDDDETRTEMEISKILQKFRKLDKTKLFPKMKVIELDVEDDTNFHIDFITNIANERAWNYHIKTMSRLKCKCIAGNIDGCLSSTISVVCGLMELEFCKLNLGLQYIYMDKFYNTNINLAISLFVFFPPEPAIKHKEFEEMNPVMMQMEKHVPYPSNWTSWDFLVVDIGNVSIGEFVNEFPKLFNGITIELLFKAGKIKNGLLLYNVWMNKKSKEHRDLKLIDQYIECYGSLASDKINYILLTGLFYTKDNDIADLPQIKYFFK